MTDLPLAQTVRRAGEWRGVAEIVTLDYDTRFLRRKRLATDTGRPFVIDLEKTTSLEDGDALELDDGSRVVIRAAEEDVLVVTGKSLPRLAWHIGNRHTPCQVDPDRLLIQRDPVIRRMLDLLGATVEEARHPFTPEGGAYGHGRTHSHDHGHSPDRHQEHDPEHDHDETVDAG
jgi:urease accessory protein